MSDAVGVRSLQLVEVAGTHREMGRQYGEALRASIQRHVEWLLSKSMTRTGMTRHQLLERVARYIPSVETYAPHLADEIRGVSEGARLSDERYAFALQMPKEMLGFLAPVADECTTFAVTGERAARGQTIVGQNVDNRDDEFFGVILKMKPDSGPQVLMYTKAGLVSYVGLNDAGLAVHGNGISSSGWRVGYPLYLIGRLMLEHSTVEDALDAALKPERARSRNLILGDTTGAIADLELAPEEFHVIRPQNGHLGHANHFVASGLCGSDAPVSNSSECRHARMNALLETSDQPLRVEDLQGFFRDHHGYPKSICAHACDEHGTSDTVVSLISEPSEGRLRAAPGHPCENDYVIYAF